MSYDTLVSRRVGGWMGGRTYLVFNEGKDSSPGIVVHRQSA